MPASGKHQERVEYLGFEGGDVTIFLGNLNLRLHSDDLSDKCEHFFHAFSDPLSPKEFTLRPGTQVSEWLVVPAYDQPSNPQTLSGAYETACHVNKAFFSLLYRQEIELPFTLDAQASMLLEVSKLANAYGCVPTIYSTISGILAKHRLAEDLCVHYPFIMVQLAIQIHNRALFSRAMNLVVGKRDFILEDLQRLPKSIVDSVNERANNINTFIEQCWQKIRLLLEPQRHHQRPRIKAIIALRIYIRRLQQRGPTNLHEDINYEVFKSLYHMEHVDTVLEIARESYPRKKEEFCGMEDKVDSKAAESEVTGWKRTCLLKVDPGVITLKRKFLTRNIENLPPPIQYGYEPDTTDNVVSIVETQIEVLRLLVDIREILEILFTYLDNGGHLYFAPRRWWGWCMCQQ